MTLEVINGLTGEVMTAQLFVAALGIQLHLCRGNLHAEPRRLDRLAHARFRVLWRRARDGGVGQPEVRDHQGMLLRAGGEPQLLRDGGPLRHGHRSGAAQEAARLGDCFILHSVLVIAR